MQKLNQKIIKIKQSSFEIEISKQIELDHDYPVALMASVIDIQHRTNHDGTYNEIYVMQPTGQYKILDEYKQKSYIISDKRKASQKLRCQIMMNNNTKLDDEQYYQHYMRLLRHYWAEVRLFLDRKENV